MISHRNPRIWTPGTFRVVPSKVERYVELDEDVVYDPEQLKGPHPTLAEEVCVLAAS